MTTLLLLSVVHSDFKDRRALVAQQRGCTSGGVQLEDAAAAVLVPEQEVFVVAETEGVVQLLTFVHRLVMCERVLLLISPPTANIKVNNTSNLTLG